MKNLLVISTILLSSVSYADVITCDFTEPFYTTTYDTSKSTLVYFDAVMQKKRTVRNVSFRIKAPSVFELVKEGKVVQTMVLNYQGSDGMSENLYSYDVIDRGLLDGNRGGCESQYLSKKE